MINTVFKGLPTDEVRLLQKGGPDANGIAPEVAVSNGNGNPCRHCLNDIDEGDSMLVLSYKPFISTQPYAEQGPIFLHAHACEAHESDGELPEILTTSPHFMMRAYGADERIIYGTGKIVSPKKIQAYASELLENENVKFIHVRSASNNCYQARIERA